MLRKLIVQLLILEIDTLSIDNADISEAVDKVRYVTKIANIAASSIVS